VTFPLLFWYFQASFPPVVTGIAVYIAIRQWQTNRNKVQLDLFDRRFRVFEEVKKVLSSVTPDGRVKMDEFLKFRTGIPEAYFLFGPDIENYIDDIYLHGRKMNLADLQLREKPEGYDPKRLAVELDSHLGWLLDELPVAKVKFKKYLDLSKL
jgi:hypothetical protein